MGPVFNFSAGPAMLPREVIQSVQAELLDFEGCGMSVMELSHRGDRFMRVLAQAEADLRELMAVPSNYRILFMHGGASFQNSAIPINLLRGRKSADYVLTGLWGYKSFQEAERFCRVNVAASARDSGYTHIPPLSAWRLDPDAAYVHYVSNETVHGVEFQWVPETGDVPLVADMSSNILSRPVDVSKFGLIYAGTQKNIGIAGMAVVIVRDDLLGQALPGQTILADYLVAAKNDSMFNTPPTFSVYMTGQVFKWVKRHGGVAAMAEHNRRKADMLYGALDRSAFYTTRVARADRSWMNVPFFLPARALEAQFVKEAEAAGLTQLKGHVEMGGIRASIYNAMPVEGVQALIDFMDDFARRNG